MKLETPVQFTREISPICLYEISPIADIGLRGIVTGI